MRPATSSACIWNEPAQFRVQRLHPKTITWWANIGKRDRKNFPIPQHRRVFNGDIMSPLDFGLHYQNPFRSLKTPQNRVFLVERYKTIPKQSNALSVVKGRLPCPWACLPCWVWFSGCREPSREVVNNQKPGLASSYSVSQPIQNSLGFLR